MTRDTLLAISVSLKAVYRGTVVQPLPIHLLDLLERLEEAERKRLPMAA